MAFCIDLTPLDIYIEGFEELQNHSRPNNETNYIYYYVLKLSAEFKIIIHTRKPSDYYSIIDASAFSIVGKTAIFDAVS
jgi:hypothetical protein